ncbi:FAD-dependent monooxygenase [Bradyrhizobium jicamae]|uniref:FAD-dependent oxidoreductase n=1 Tax=Bradyrhizobium jicamae TaxID=280332 RepID=UPI001BA5BE37|nr:FAD-dependent monooxygenase [Bradyrhizobium jicamae]MBR0755304.1 FAD-dependent monooxygenase [Bradyrhizobium jicamae]
MTTAPSSLRSLSHIAIIGGGLGGLLLARMLQLRGVPFTVYEREASPTSRPQGGALDMHPETGQEALRRAGLLERFHDFARYEDQAVRSFDKYGQLQFEQLASDVERQRPEIDRGQLRALLMEKLPAGAIKWNHSFVSAKSEGETLVLDFADGCAEQAGFLVGADGARSRVRALLSDVPPIYTGTTMYELSIDDADTQHAPVGALVGRGMLSAKGDGKTLIAQRNAGAHIRVYVVLGRASRGIAETRQSLIDELHGWDDRLVDIVRAAGPTVRALPLEVLPIGHKWPRHPRMTLLGDAAHLMPPAGEGANLALLDAADLADALNSEGSRDQAIRSYEDTMIARGADAARRAMHVLENGGPQSSEH